MMSYSQGRLSENSAFQKYQFLIFRTHEGDFGCTAVKNDNRQNSAMNFRNSKISTLLCLKGRESYQKVESVLKSNKKWIYYSDFKKDVSS